MPSDALAQHGRTTAELASFLLELGDIRAAVVKRQADTWAATGHLNVTERREECRCAVAPLEEQAAKVTGEVDARRAELAHLDLLVRYSRADSE